MVNFKEMCNGSTSSEDFVACVEEKTFGLRDILNCLLIRLILRGILDCLLILRDILGDNCLLILTITGLRDVLGDIEWNGEWVGLGASFGVFNGENQLDVKNLTDPSHWISEVVLGSTCSFHFNNIYLSNQ